ncbi:hypothetical protein [Tepidibacter formicigenes]|uniref:Uncharacterized protein n=1 Tax=Tepidibacter formicigenes DSM 15518 TaxID=1123349 RepID=A0A1M6N1G1_9FIRM|nr:hypothetical protein [Tepidibacter formicigenes]SHJ89547.1 hypothetical protein SAMN02744037_01133 [Tepidibacter formicigenes DSM 15518]
MKIDKEKLKNANVDKEKINKMKEKIKNEYEGKTEEELMDELKKVSKKIDNKDKILQKLKPLLNKKQQQKLDKIMKELKK